MHICSQFERIQRFVRRKVVKIRYPGECTWDGVDITFIVCTGRTGTQFLSHFFPKACRRTYACHEPSPDMLEMAISYLNSEVTLDEATAALWNNRQQICKDIRYSGSRHYVEANVNLSCLVPVLRECFKGCRIIHLIRDGRTWVRSAYSKMTIGKDGRPALFMSDNDPRRRISAIDFKDDPYSRVWQSFNRFERLCWYWAKINDIISVNLADYKNHLTVKYESLFDGERRINTILKMICFMGLENDMIVSQDRLSKLLAVKADPTRKYLLPQWQEWTKAQKTAFTKLAGASFKRYGYEIED